MNNEVVSRAEAYLEYAQKIRNDYPEPVARMDYHLLSVAELVRLGGADVQTIKDAVNDYLTLNPPQTMTDSQIATSVNKSLSDGSINVGGITDNTLDTTDKTYVGAINEVNTNSTHTNRTVLDNLTDKDGSLQYKGKDITGGSGTTDYVDLTNKPSINGVELSGDKSLSDLGITNYDDTQVKQDISDLKTDKQDKTDNSLNTIDKTITGAINEVNGTQLDTVGFSADYKNIILNRKNGLNPYTIPIASIINNASLTELKDIDSTDIGNGKTLVYDATTQKHKYVDSAGTDELVKMDASTDAKYLSDLIDKQTIINYNGTLKVQKLDGQEVTIAEINYLKGLTMNVMDLVNMFANGGVKIINTPVATYSDLLAYDKTGLIEGISYLVYVLADETHDNAKTTYLIDKDTTTPAYFGFAGEHRDFTTNPIDLANEVTGKLGTSNIDVDNLWKLLTINDTYKTLTATNNVFGTHGAKAMYDELVTSIGGKANQTDLDTHTNDTTIHTTQAEKDSYIKKTDIIDNLTSTDTDKPLSANQGKILEDKKLNKDDANVIEIINADNVNIKDFILEKCTDKNKIYYITARSTCTETPKTSTNYYMIVEKIGDFTIKVKAYELAGKDNIHVCTYRSDDSKWTEWAKVLSSSDITTTINSSSTDEQIPGAKTIYNKFRTQEMRDFYLNMGNANDLAKFGLNDYSSLTNPLDLTNKTGTNSRIIVQSNAADTADLFRQGFLPISASGLMVITTQALRSSAIYTTDTGDMYYCTSSNGAATTFTAWKKVCTTTVQDVAKTLITFSDSTNHEVTTPTETYYIVKNGICYVQMVFKCLVDNATTFIGTLPKPLSNATLFAPQAVPWEYNNLTAGRVRIGISNVGNFQAIGGTAGVIYSCNFSYPVAES